ncbi:MAG: hypothetical protein NVSMB42_17860 [Herpetosiphon sp.]
MGRSPLAVNMRIRAVSPAIIQPITGILQYLFQPIILLAILGVSGAVHYWLYMVHGLATATKSALDTPGLMLLLLLIIVTSAAFHEFGHASALRYGGGKVGGMGAGFYLIYPAFYTDVTDSYRLGRWGRVRTDLGGFYFNLIFELGLLGIYLLTKQEFLLLSMLLLDLEIMHQSLPFVRLDGYWALADLTGIPDFFSQMIPFIRSIIPLPWLKDGRKLPNMKWWVKLVFVLYIVVTIPLLIFLLFVMIKSVPRVLATAWEAFGKQQVAFGQAWQATQVLGILAAGLQILLLALPVFGLLFALYALGKRALVALYTWSKPTPARRLTGGLVSTALVALLAYLWLPQIPWSRTPQAGPLYAFAASRFTPIQPDERGTIAEAVTDPGGGGFSLFGGVPIAPSGGMATPTPTGTTTGTPAAASSAVVPAGAVDATQTGAPASSTPMATTGASPTVTATPATTATSGTAVSPSAATQPPTATVPAPPTNVPTPAQVVASPTVPAPATATTAPPTQPVAPPTNRPAVKPSSTPTPRVTATATPVARQLNIPVPSPTMPARVATATPTAVR